MEGYGGMMTSGAVTGSEINGRRDPVGSGISSDMGIANSHEITFSVNGTTTAKIYPLLFADNTHTNFNKHTVLLIDVGAKSTLERDYCLCIPHINEKMRLCHEAWARTTENAFKQTPLYAAMTKNGVADPFRELPEAEFFAREYSLERFNNNTTRSDTKTLFSGYEDVELLAGTGEFSDALEFTTVQGFMRRFRLLGVITGDRTNAGSYKGNFSQAVGIARFMRCLDYWGAKNNSNELGSHVGFQVKRKDKDHPLQLLPWSSGKTGSTRPSGANAWTVDVNGFPCPAGFMYLGVIVEPPSDTVAEGPRADMFSHHQTRAFTATGECMRGGTILALDVANAYNFFDPHM